MKIKELMELPLKEVLEKYSIVYNLECGYYYGFVSYELLDKLFEEYNIVKDYPEAFSVESVINEELTYDDNSETLDYHRLEKIMKNLGISKK